MNLKQRILGDLVVFDDGCSDEMIREVPERNGAGRRSPADWVALALAVPAAWLFWIYVAQPVWSFIDDVVEASRMDLVRQESISHMVGKCYTSAIGSLGAVISIENGTTVKMAFKGGVTGTYPVSALKPAECPVL